MADLKDFDEKGLLEAITWAARRAQESVETTAQSILDDIRTVARAQAELPKRLDDLLARAVGFWVKEYKLEVLRGHDDGGWPVDRVQINFGNRCIHLTNPHECSEREPRILPPKRYRFILIVQEVDDVRSA
jgi:hypothetical protein